MGKATRKKSSAKKKKSKLRNKAAAMMGGNMDTSAEMLEGAPIPQPAVGLKNPSQRHRYEYKKMREYVQQLKAERMKLGSRTLDKKATKKELTKEIKQLEQEFKERTEREVAEFEEGKRAIQKLSDGIERLEKTGGGVKAMAVPKKKKKKRKGRYISQFASMTSDAVKSMFVTPQDAATAAAAKKEKEKEEGNMEMKE